MDSLDRSEMKTNQNKPKRRKKKKQVVYVRRQWPASPEDRVSWLYRQTNHFPRSFLGELQFLEMKHKQIIKKELPVGRETVFTREDVPSWTSNCRSLSHIDLISCSAEV